MKSNNYPHLVAILKDGQIQIEANLRVKPTRSYNSLAIPENEHEWKNCHEYFKFENEEESDKLNSHVYSKIHKQEYVSVDIWESELSKGISVDCIEIKDGLAYFKEENSCFDCKGNINKEGECFCNSDDNNIESENQGKTTKSQSQIYREAFPNKTDEQIIESLASEVKQKVEAIYQLQESISSKDQIINELKVIIDCFQEKYDENGQNAPLTIKLQRSINHANSTIDIYASQLDQKDQHITEIKSGFELLLEDYKRRLATISDIILSTGNNGGENDIKKMERLKTKQSEYQTFICELGKELLKN